MFHTGTSAMRILLSTLAALAVFSSTVPAAQARPGEASAASSALSTLPIAVSIAAPAGLLSAGATLSVVAVQASAEGTVWVLERASDGARASVTLSGQVVGGASLAVGTAVTVTAFSAGWVLSAAGRAIAYLPNAVGTALLHNERVTR